MSPSRCVVGIALVLGTIASPAAAGHEATRPNYARPAGDTADRAPDPPAREIPTMLRLARAGRTAVPTPAPAPGRPSRLPAIDAEAERAADWALRTWSVPELERTYWLSGARQGWGDALADRRLGQADEADGRRLGLRDPDARRVGIDLARDEAGARAWNDASRAVADAFGDLTREPRYDPRPFGPAFAVEGPFAIVPALDQVMLEIGPRGELRVRLDALSRDVRWFHEHSQFVERQLSDPRRALSTYLADTRRSAFRGGLTEAGRLRFDDVFTDAFLDGLDRAYVRRLEPAWRIGLIDGWREGARVVAEWRFRLGWSAGFEIAAADAAAAEFPRAYRRAFADVYRDEFDAWSTSTRPELTLLDVRDADDDGVLEPGEDVVVRVDIANFGGRGARLDLSLDGATLTVPARRRVGLPARDVVTETIAARIDPAVPPRTRDQLTLRLDGLERSVPVSVARPLRFAETPRIDRDDLAGGFTMQVAVRNDSRRAREAVVRIERLDGGPLPPARQLGTLAGGAVRTVQFEFAALDPLALIAGDVTVGLAVESGAVIQDRDVRRLPGRVDDASDRALLDVALAIARDPGAERATIQRAQSLLLRRMEADWRAATYGRGNPYRLDWRDGGERTTLGALVAIYRAERSTMASPQLFTALAAEIDLLADDLPGLHPRLRKYVRRLANRLT